MKKERGRVSNKADRGKKQERKQKYRERYVSLVHYRQMDAQNIRRHRTEDRQQKELERWKQEKRGMYSRGQIQ